MLIPISHTVSAILASFVYSIPVSGGLRANIKWFSGAPTSSENLCRGSFTRSKTLD